MQGATLGVPSEPGIAFDEMVEEVMDEVKKRRGSKGGPEGPELRKRVEDALYKKSKSDGAAQSGLKGVKGE